MEKKFICRCGKKYHINSSLYNHIKLKHENKKLQFNISVTTLGRPEGQKNKVKDSEQQKRRSPAKQLLCKCNKTFKGEGSLSNHIRIKHGDDPLYQIEKKKQGRKKREAESTENINIITLYSQNIQFSQQYNKNTAIYVGQLNNQENYYESFNTAISSQINTYNNDENEEPLNYFQYSFYEPQNCQSYQNQENFIQQQS
ncbi:hypothetical protein ABPG74_009794 [Tetrahymena malaccensis]